MAAEANDPRLDALPPRVLPLLYIGTAHASLALALASVAWWPRAVTGFFYHSWMVALVHLVTLGWITLSILGALYIVGPMALRMPIPARRGDYVAYALLVIGLVGMVAHFWIGEFGGMAWSAGTAAGGILYVMIRVMAALGRSAAPREVKLHIRLAAVNLLGAATVGVLLACDKVYHFLPGYILSNVLAHAHLAAVGWATMMVVGVGYRLLPMVLPAAPPQGRSVALSAILLEAGIVLLFVGLIAGARWTPVGGLLIVAGLLSFFRHVVVMARHPRPRPVGAVRPDFAVWHAMAAGACLIAAMVIGLILLVMPMSERTLRAALAYGVLGLLGFLSQMILGIETRILPIHAWYWAFADTGFQGPVVAPQAMGSQTLRMLVFYLWLWGVPALALGFFTDRSAVVGAGAWALLAGVILAAFNTASVLAHAIDHRSLRAPTGTDQGL
ncbi:MAG: hypothetical protein Q7J25_02705 [Vicinamibacterales bacterium]|nr:hypothetical protein [Vicinamibacterales bacterium]